MADQVPKGYSWIRDLAPGVSYNDESQDISMNDGTVIPKNLYTIVNDRAYVDPSSFSSFLQSSGYKPLRSLDSTVGWDSKTGNVTNGSGSTLPKALYALVNGTSYIKPDAYSQYTASQIQKSPGQPLNSTAIRDIIPDVKWDSTSNSITLPNGKVLDKSTYQLNTEDGKSYTNPYTLAGYFQPSEITPERVQGFANVASEAYQPHMDAGYQRLNNLVKFINTKLNANVRSYEAAGDRSLRQLQRQEGSEASKLTKQAMARGTYNSGVADYAQRQLAQQYAPEYANLQDSVAANIAAANAQSQQSLSEVANSAKDLEASYSQQIFSQAIQLAQMEADREQQVFNNIMSIAGANDSRTVALAQARVQKAVDRTNAIGYVTSEADASVLGVPVGTPSATAAEAAANRAAQLEQVKAQIDAQIKMNDADNATSRANAATNAAASVTAASLGQSSIDAQRRFSQAMAVWEQTGVAPSSPELQAYGIAAGAAWNLSVADKVKQAELDKYNKEQKIQDTVRGWQSNYSLDAATATQAAYLTEGVDFDGAMARFKANKNTLKSQGVNTNSLEKAIKASYGR